MPKRRKRRKLRLNWTLTIWLMLIANVAVGYVYSPISSPTKIRVIGAPREDQMRITAYLTDLANLPFSKISIRQVETQVVANPAISGADFTLNPFGRGILRVKARTPVARISNAKNVVLGDDGVVFRSTAAGLEIPSLKLPSEALNPNLSLFAPWEPARVAKICADFSAILPKGLWEITIDQRGAICFNRTGSCRILLGDTDALEEKLQTLRKILADQPQILERAAELNLTEPSSPRKVPRHTK